jgi:hypothetical protein
LTIFNTPPARTLNVNEFLGGTSVGTDQNTLLNTSVSDPTFANWTREFASVLAGKTLSELDITLNASAFHPPFSFGSSEAIDNVALTPVGTTVPEPSTWAMMALGFSALGLAGWRSRRGSVSIP